MKKFFQSVKNFFKQLLKKVGPKGEDFLKIGLKVVDSIKNFDTKNPYVGDIITSLIPGEVDDRIKEKIRKELPKILIQLRLVESTINQKDPEQIVLSAIKTLQQIKSDWEIKGTFLDGLAALLADVAADGEIDWNDAKTVVKWYHDHKYRKAA